MIIKYKHNHESKNYSCDPITDILWCNNYPIRIESEYGGVLNYCPKCGMELIKE